MFQILIGRLETLVREDGKKVVIKKFQILIGRLETQADRESHLYVVVSNPYR